MFFHLGSDQRFLVQQPAQSFLLFVEYLSNRLSNLLTLFLDQLPILLKLQLIRPHLLKHIHLITRRFLRHLAEHQAPYLVIHNRCAIRIRFHVDNLIGLEIFD